MARLQERKNEIHSDETNGARERKRPRLTERQTDRTLE